MNSSKANTPPEKQPNYANMVGYSDAKTAYRHCREKIILLKKNKPFYIGATNNPDDRLKQHINNNMSTMHVLCKVPTKIKTENLEKKLIKNSHTKLMINQSGGGEGLNDGINYIYILF
jgi:predicted GIY-YIG superfamily endonuclease